jgi:hypothetical protein
MARLDGIGCTLLNGQMIELYIPLSDNIWKEYTDMISFFSKKDPYGLFLVTWTLDFFNNQLSITRGTIRSQPLKEDNDNWVHDDQTIREMLMSFYQNSL